MHHGPLITLCLLAGCALGPEGSPTTVDSGADTDPTGAPDDARDTNSDADTDVDSESESESDSDSDGSADTDADTDTDTGGSQDTDTDSDSDTDTDSDTGPSPPDPCAGAALCDDFEGQVAGSAPTHGWTVTTPNCSGSGAITVDDSVAFSGTRSVRVDGHAGYCNHVFLQVDAGLDGLGTTVHGRFRVRFQSALGWDHVTFLTMPDANGGRDLRMGGQSQILMWNRESDDATLPELSPTGIGLSTAPVPGQWHCVAFTLDEDAGTLTTSVDGTTVAALVIDGVSTPDVDAQWLRPGPWHPDVTTARVGWESYGGSANTLWFDDVAFSDQPLPCTP